MEFLKKLWSKIWFKYLLIAIIIALMIPYFKVYSQEGIYFEETFLKKTTQDKVTTFEGKHPEGPIEIQVLEIDANTYQVTYALPNLADRVYDLVTEPNPYGRVVKFKVYEKDQAIFSGKYSPGSSIVEDDDGEIYFNYHFVSPAFDQVTIFDSNYEIRITTTLSLAMDEFFDIRGRAQLMAPALLLLILWAVDILYPRFLFMTQHFLSVRDPEPSDLYLFMQKLYWAVMPLFILILLLKSIGII